MLHDLNLIAMMQRIGIVRDELTSLECDILRCGELYYRKGVWLVLH